MNLRLKSELLLLGLQSFMTSSD